MKAALEFFDLDGFDMPSLAIAWLGLWFLVVVYALQCARPLALDVRRWLLARGR